MLMSKNLFFNVKLKFPINFNFSPFHEHIFRSSRTQMFFKIGVLKHFAILRIRRDSNTVVFLQKAATRQSSLKRCSFLQAYVNILIDFLLKMLG